MSRWRAVRLAIIGLAFLAALLGPAAVPAKPPMTWLAVGVIFAVFPAAMLVGFGVLSIFRGRRLEWQPPSWDKNPFTLAHPEQFFHFGAFIVLASGAAMLARTVFAAAAITPSSCAPIALGAGVLTGLRLLTAAYRIQSRNRA